MQSISRRAPLPVPASVSAEHPAPPTAPNPLHPSLHPELIEAAIEASLEAQALELEIQPSEAPFCETHLKLSGEVCPDPLLALSQMGAALAQLPDAENRRISFSGSQGDDGPTWIGFIDLAEFVPQPQEPRPLLGSVADIARFITEQSSWFSTQVKQTPRLHRFAKQSQEDRIQETARAIALLLHPQEQLLDVLPVRYRRKASSLILTERRLLCLGQTLLRHDANASLDLPLSNISYIALAPNGLVIREPQSEHRLYFSTTDTDSLEILLAYFTRVIRRDVIPETVSRLRQQAMGGGLVASLLLGAGLTISGTADFLLEQTSRQTRRLEPDPIAQLKQSLQISGPLPSVPAPTDAQVCIDQFNQVLGSQGYAALNRASKTMLISLERFAGGYTNGLQFDAIANQIAVHVFAACGEQTVEQVRVEDGHYSFLKHKSEGK